MESEYCNNVEYREIGIYGEFGRRTFGENCPTDRTFLRLCDEECGDSRKINTLKGKIIKYCAKQL